MLSREPRLGVLGSEGAREGESEVGFVDVLSGGELHRLGAVWLGADVETALAACRAEHSQGRVASAEGARDAGVGAKPGAGEAVLAGARRMAGQWRRRRRTPSRRETEREEKTRW